jgi:predicted dehydrogenase
LCTPTSQHYEQVLAAWEQGWHVLCEKPLATTAEHIRQLLQTTAAGRQRGQVFAVAYQRRHSALFRTLRREVLSSLWGPLQAVSLHCVEDWQSTITGTWRDDPQQNPGGFLADAGSHKLDLLSYLTGQPPEKVFARGWTCGSRVNILTSVSAVLQSGVPVTMDFIGQAQRLAEDWSLHCAQADLICRDERLWLGRHGRLEELPVDEPESSPVQAFLDVILQSAENMAPPECAWPVWQWTQAIAASSREAREVVVAQLTERGGDVDPR